jgi:hypothetical protein
MDRGGAGLVLALAATVILAGCDGATAASGATTVAAAASPVAAQTAAALIEEGRQTFRFDTFGDEQLWTDTLRLHEVVEKGVDPTTALKVGLKVDADVLPTGILQTADLKSPATTIALLKMNAIVGIQAKVDEAGRITSLGVTCALCHSNVDNSSGRDRPRARWLAEWDLNVGAAFAGVAAAKGHLQLVGTRQKYDPR